MHVRGHQDRNPDAQLSIEAQLNVHADALAGEYSALLQSASIDTTAEMVPMLPVTGALLDLEIGTVTGHYSTMIRMYNSEREIKQYTQQKAEWSDETTEMINWRLLRQHMQKQAHVNIWSCKYMHNLLPTGNIRHRYNPREPAGCPRCQHSKETWDHILQCTHDDNKKISRKIRAQIFKHIDELVAPAIGRAMKTGISTYIGEQYGEVQELPQQVQNIYFEQEKIGWKQFLQGYWSQRWTAEMHQLRPPEENGTAVVDWRVKLLGQIWTAMSQGWQEYTTRLHQKTEDRPALKTQHLHHRI